MTAQDTVTHRCKTCQTPVEVALLNVSTLQDHSHGLSRFLWGRWEKCPGCGTTEQPGLVVDDTDLLTQFFDNGVWTR